jgi:hypothetical protein
MATLWRFNNKSILSFFLLLLFLSIIKNYYSLSSFLVNSYYTSLLTGYKYNPNSTFNCSYAVSFTSIPSRFAFALLQIASINRETQYKSPQIILNVSKFYLRFGRISNEEIELLESVHNPPNVIINWVPDKGPINKLLGVLLSNCDRTLIIDDERDYSSEVFKYTCLQTDNRAVYRYNQMEEQNVMGSYAYVLPTNRDMIANMLSSYNKTIWGFEDDLYITCMLIKHYSYAIRVYPILEVKSRWQSEITNSRRSGLNEQTSTKGESTNKELFEKRKERALRGDCY